MQILSHSHSGQVGTEVIFRHEGEKDIKNNVLQTAWWCKMIDVLY